jgi:SAM-dependent methyltransferase
MSLTVFLNELIHGKSLMRAQTYSRIKGYEISGTVLDLGSKLADAYHHRHLVQRDVKITFADLYSQTDDVVQVDLNKPLPFDDSSQDHILLFFVMEYLTEPTLCLSECERILKPGGKILGASPFITRPADDPVDLHRYTAASIQRMLESSRFGSIKVDSIGTGPFGAALHQLIPFIRPAWLRFPFIAAALFFDKLIRLKGGDRWRNIYPLGFVFEASNTSS